MFSEHQMGLLRRAVTVNIRAADTRRHLSISSLEPNFGILEERTAILAYDISLERGSLRSGNVLIWL
jgi:hypothetical protein